MSDLNPKEQVFNTADIKLHVVSGDRVTLVSANISLPDPRSGHFKRYETYAEAIASSQDRPDEDVGVALAIGRAVRQLGREIHKDAQREVYRRDKLNRR